MILVQILASITLALIPAYIIRCNSFDFCDQISPIPLTLIEVLIIATTLVWFLWRIYLLKKRKISIFEPFQSLPRPFILTIGLFLMAGLISIFVSADIRAAAGIFKAYFAEPAAFSLVVFDLSKSKKSLNWLVLPFILSGVWVSIFAVYQYFTGQLVPTHEVVRERISSIYTTSNAIGLYLGPLLFFSLGLIWAAAKNRGSAKKVQIYLILSSILFGVAIILSGSRGAILASIVGFIFFISYTFYLRVGSRMRAHLNKIFLFLVAVFVLINLIFVSKIASNPGHFFDQPYFNTINSRFCLWQKSSQILAKNPVFGTGLSSFRQVSQNHPVCKTDLAIYPHNIFLNFWSETGVLGLGSFLVLIFILWSKLNKSGNFIAAGILAAVIYIFIHGTVDVPYFKNDLSSEFWVIVAISAWINQSRDPDL